VVATGRYRHDELRNLDSPVKDAEVLAGVLGNPELGGFDVEVLNDAPSELLRRRIYEFCAADRVEEEDFLVLYFSCHGMKDADGTAYLVASDTDPTGLPWSGVSSGYIVEQLGRCRAKRLVAFFDCCYAGAFLRGFRPRGLMDSHELKEIFEGQGRVVICASSAIQSAFEGDPLPVGAKPSAFADAFTTGIESGDAVLVGNGWISVREAFDHAARKLRGAGIPQTPIISGEGTGDLYISKAPLKPGALPEYIQAVVNSPHGELRYQAVAMLRELEYDDDLMGLAVLSALETLQRDPVGDVASAARAARAQLSPLLLPVRSADSSLRSLPIARDVRWYMRAVFYEITVRCFQDSNADGTGDLAGLIKRLDYLQWLGIDCLLLTPVFPSPQRDGGYDSADFTMVDPEFGTLSDFVELVEQCHTRGMRLVMDFVVNHTSDAHPWFQASRSDPDGPFGDFYVWTDNPDKYHGARIIFVDTETSNWTFDPVRGQYFWHRFFSHEPDLNFENPKVQDAMIEVLQFWFDLGIDGCRLVAAPFLYEREGTNCENLRETHEYLKRVRRKIDSLYPDRLVLIDANQWPADLAEYFGDPESGGNECHMVFHAALMPRIFMAVRREQRYPISEILAQTPSIPASCQWGIFLRNHDELALEVLSPDERDYMYAEYATDPRAKANVGIRSRLAPLLRNDRNQLELFTALLLSLPGSPVMYYGDEIGMGDNIWLGDRDAHRTPMQWTSDRNGGFSAGDPQRLYLPPVMDPIFGYMARNVDAQQRDPSSLLQRIRLLIEVRKRFPVLAIGEYEELMSTNPSILVFVRLPGDIRQGIGEALLCVFNLSRFPQPVELDLRQFRGKQLVECTGGVIFPPIGRGSYLMTLPGHGFYWFALGQADMIPAEPQNGA
jgi:maltose alpha-D-glucosyltransferase / alpha-amylase